MKWITREKVKVDRVACPWLIQKFIDPEADSSFCQQTRTGRKSQMELSMTSPIANWVITARTFHSTRF